MARRVSHVFQIVVFAASAHTSLRCRRARVAAFVCTQKNVFELHHASVRKQQRAIIGWHQWARRDYLVPFLAKVLEEHLSNFITASHDLTVLDAPGVHPLSTHWKTTPGRPSWRKLLLLMQGSRRYLHQLLASPAPEQHCDDVLIRGILARCVLTRYVARQS